MSLKKLLPKMGQYGNFYLPMTFSKFNTKDVVLNTRKPGYCTVFDVSHMGIFESFINQNISLEKLLHKNLTKLNENKSSLSVILNKGGVVDDLIIGNIDGKKYRLIVNANTKDYFREKNFLTEKEKTIIAIQGPNSQKVLEELTNDCFNDLYFMENKTIYSNKFEVTRCGYTGEDGFELYMDKDIGDDILNKLVHLSLINDSVMFGGLVERDILRMEAGMCLSGNEFSKTNPADFNSLSMKFLVDQKYRKTYIPLSKLTKFTSNKPIEKTIIYQNSEQVGVITSSTKSFNLNKFIGLGYLNTGIDKTDIYFIKNKRKTKLKVVDSFILPNYYRRS